MQRNFNTDERLSFLRPNAESTMNGTFQWGRKDFNNSAILQTSKSAKSPQRCLSKVDARVYADVQSRGLASRIVKYHENGTRFNRSSSLTNLSSKNSPLSLKKLEAKPQLRYDKAIKQNVSMTHIAPPDKSLFYGNTLSGLLRSNSVITLQQNDDDLSSENRPIIHPPVTEKELQPTRSVLEVLKEISRKRINNEVLPDNEETIDTSKKYCGRIVDTAHFSGNDYRLQQIQTSPPPPPHTYKRQRESTVDGYIPSCLSRDVNSYQAKLQQPELPASPEQQSKRRHCNYNNDITSSLSSSAKSSTIKRKLYENDGYKRQEKLLRYHSEVRLPEISTAINYGNKLPITPLPNTPQTLSNEIAALPAVAVKKCASAPLPTVANSTQDTKTVTAKPKLTLFNRNYETKVNVEPSIEQATLNSNEEDDAYAGINFVKPKKSTTSISGSSASNLVMQRTRKSKLALMLSGLRGELYLGDEEEEQRVKGITSSTTNKDIQKETQQQHPALLPVATPLTLTNTFDDKQKTTVIDKPDASEKTTQPAVAVTSIATSPTAAVLTTSQPTKIVSPLTGIKLTPITTTMTNNTNNSQTTTAPSTALTFNFGSNIAATSKPSLSFNTPALTSNITTAATTITTSTTSFSFGAPTGAAAAATTTANPTPILQFGLPTTSSSLVTTTSNANTVNAAGSTLNFNFGSTGQSSQTTSATSAPSASVTAPFSFGNTATSNAASTSTTFSTTTSATPAFSFGGLTASQATNKPATSMPAPTNVNIVKPAATVAATFNFTSNKPTTTFSFGANTNAATTTISTTTTSEAPKMFSFSSSPKTINSTASGAFSFGSNNHSTLESKTTQSAASFGGAITQGTTAPPTFGTLQADQAKNTASNNSFVFGAKPANQSTAVAQPPPTFGANTALPQAQENKNGVTNSFMFGGTASSSTLEQQSTKPTFSAVTNNNNNAGGLFGLNATNSLTATTTTTNDNTKSSNAFSFSNAAASPKTFSFGAASSTTNAVSDASKSTNLFGAAIGNNQQSKPFSFGSQNAAATTSEPTKVVNAGNTFNFSNTNQGNNNAFTFAGASSNANNNNKPVLTNSFGAVAAPNNKQTSGGFSFGQTNNNTTNGAIFNFNASQKNASGSSNVVNQTENNKPTTTTNTFGAFTNNSAPSGGGFVFGANTNAKTPTPSFGSTSSTNAPNTGIVFGATPQQNNSATNSAAGNLFATASAPAAAQSGNLFGGAANTSSASNIFGSNSNATPIFGATSAAAAAGSGTTTATNNLFAVTANASSERPIRRATRRLAKP